MKDKTMKNNTAKEIEMTMNCYIGHGWDVWEYIEDGEELFILKRSVKEFLEDEKENS